MIKQFLSKIPKNIVWMCLGMFISSLFAFRFITTNPCCAISFDRQNVFYIGVDNPVRIVTQGMGDAPLTITGHGVTLTKIEGEEYNVTCSTPSNDASINIKVGKKNQGFPFRVKRIPNPLARLGGRYDSRTIGNGEFRAQESLNIVLDNFYFDAKCELASFKITKITKRQDPVDLVNIGEKFNPQTLELVKKAVPGDVYYFDEIKVNCPSDVAARSIGGLVFNIK
jgi:hypothetical protein